MNKIEDDILNNMKFRQIFSDNVANNPWLLNYEKGTINLPDGGRGTVYSMHDKTGKNEYQVRPSIMEDEEGKLQFYGDDAWDIAGDKGYGITFSSDQEAQDFSKWLSKLHEMSIENQQSYEL